MQPSIRPVRDSDWPAVTAIFNHFVLESFAAYPDRPVDEGFLRGRAAAAPDYPFLVAEVEEDVVGFAYPVVPEGQARIRTQMSAGHDRSHLDRALAAFEKTGQELGVIA